MRSWAETVTRAVPGGPAGCHFVSREDISVAPRNQVIASRVIVAQHRSVANFG